MKQLYQVQEVASSIYHIFEPAGVCSTLIVGQTSALLIDTGYGFEDLSVQVRKLTDLPLQIVNTHCHLDHAGGNHFFEEVAYVHPYEKEVYRTYQLDKPGHLDFVRKKFQNGKIENPFAETFDSEDYIQYRPVEFQDLAHGQKFDLGGRTVEAIFLPGHTKGSVAFYDDATKTLISGDSVGGSVWMIYPQSAPLTEYMEALKWLKNHYPVEKILYSHESKVYPASLLDAVLIAVENCNPKYDKPFTHPRLGFEGYHHEEILSEEFGIKKIHIVYSFSPS